MLSDAKSILGYKRFSKALKPVQKEMTSDNTLHLVAFPLVFSRSRAGRGKGSSSDISCNIIAHVLSSLPALSLTRCQGQPGSSPSVCLCKLLRPFLSPQSGISTAHPIFLFWVHDLVVETLSLNFSQGACAVKISVKCSLFPYKGGFERSSVSCVSLIVLLELIYNFSLPQNNCPP